jgi:hypothetical protein
LMFHFPTSRISFFGASFPHLIGKEASVLEYFFSTKNSSKSIVYSIERLDRIVKNRIISLCLEHIKSNGCQEVSYADL